MLTILKANSKYLVNFYVLSGGTGAWEVTTTPLSLVNYQGKA